MSLCRMIPKPQTSDFVSISRNRPVIGSGRKVSGAVYSRLGWHQSHDSQRYRKRMSTHVPVIPVRACLLCWSMSFDAPKSDSIARGLELNIRE